MRSSRHLQSSFERVLHALGILQHGLYKSNNVWPSINRKDDGMALAAHFYLRPPTTAAQTTG